MPIKNIRAQNLAKAQLDKKETMQRIVLSALSKAGFFDEAAFYGGTCLRLIHGLDRFSEDMDFSLMEKNPKFSLEKYFPAIINEFKMYGKLVEITKKDKQSFGKVQSAFLKDNTDTYDLKFQTEKTPKIKIETDYLPPLNFTTEIKTISGEPTSAIRAFTPDCLFAGKMHAILFRQWQTRVKGRDWYDFAWYIANSIPLNFGHLQTRILEFNDKEISVDDFRGLLDNKIKELDINLAKNDVRPFLNDKSELDKWSTNYFLDLAKKINILDNPISKNKYEKIPKEQIKDLKSLGVTDTQINILTYNGYLEIHSHNYRPANEWDENVPKIKDTMSFAFHDGNVFIQQPESKSEIPLKKAIKNADELIQLNKKAKKRSSKTDNTKSKGKKP